MVVALACVDFEIMLNPWRSWNEVCHLCQSYHHDSKYTSPRRTYCRIALFRFWNSIRFARINVFPICFEWERPLNGNSWCIMSTHDTSWVWCIMSTRTDDASWVLMMHHEYSWCIMRTDDAWVLMMYHEHWWCIMSTHDPSNQEYSGCIRFVTKWHAMEVERISTRPISMIFLRPDKSPRYLNSNSLSPDLHINDSISCQCCSDRWVRYSVNEDLSRAIGGGDEPDIHIWSV